MRSSTKSPAARSNVSRATSPAKMKESAPITPAAPVTLANANGQAQADAICEALKAPSVKVSAAALADATGNFDTAAQNLAGAALTSLVIIKRIVPILRSPAPAALFDDGNNRGMRIGELFASRLGLSALYRDVTKASQKDARAHLIESAK